ncbi:protein WHAT'S THIS FACTOR 1 homolog [Cucurbita pepo subsp. pepo]|uniref:protein WHAT'S THIS FACTOR 1 homolog n=1 Tax=Cucurbita pepo subsp. pepo TaxID=3664 RepID=UPI000C9D80C5|nr:protein WHAT'S THIS FACTOR 1 homolog [Cucurbita pepo subsp. pepo]XP_023511735.1 protein WHAT'S THIS FACTOR 1 homolog [Cucurbita pepo subsp. pepo]
MNGKTMFLRLNRGIHVFNHKESGFLWVLLRHKSSGGMRPKRKIYYRVDELDKVMELQKKPSLILKLINIIQSQKHKFIFLRDLEKEVGFVQKWNFMAVIEKYSSIFYVDSGSCRRPYVRLTNKAEKIASEEHKVKSAMEPIVVKNLRKLLMLSVDCRVPLENIEFIASELGLPCDFKTSLIPEYPEFFSVKEVDGKAHLHLENWDSSLAISAREEGFGRARDVSSCENRKRVRISKDGNFSGPFAFKMCFPPGFRPNMSYLEHLERWQKMDFPSPYLNARRFDAADPKARKRVVAVLHEFLSLTMEKRMRSTQLDAFHREFLLPSKLLLCLLKHQGIFYITNKGARSTVLLKEAYEGSVLSDKCPLLLHYDRFLSLCGRRDKNCNSPQVRF